MPEEDKNQDNFREKFRALPQAAKDYFYSDKSADVLSAIAADFNLTAEQEDLLVRVASHLSVKIIPLADLQKNIGERLGLAGGAAKKMALELLGRYFLPLSGFYNEEIEKTIKALGGNVKDYPAFRILEKRETAETAGAEVAKNFENFTPEEHLKQRFTELIESYLNEVRNETAFREMLTRSAKVGGMGFDEETAQKVIEAAAEKKRSVKIVSETEAQSEISPPYDSQSEQAQDARVRGGKSGDIAELPPTTPTPPRPHSSRSLEERAGRGGQPDISAKPVEKIIPPPVVKPEPSKLVEVPPPTVVVPQKSAEDEPPKVEIKKEVPPPAPKIEQKKPAQSPSPLSSPARFAMASARRVKREETPPSPPVGEGRGEGRVASVPKKATKEISDAELSREVQHIRHDVMPKADLPPINFQSLAGEIIEESRAKLANEEQKARLQTILVARLKDIRDTNETREILARDYGLGGMGMDETTVKDLLPILDGEFKKIEERLKAEAESKIAAARRDEEERRRKAAEDSKILEQKNLDNRFSEIAAGKGKILPLRRGGEEGFHPKVTPPHPPLLRGGENGEPIIPSPAIAGRPKVQDVKYEPKLTGPVDEIGRLTLTDFRRLAPAAKEAAVKIKEKIESLKLDSIKKWQEGVVAWKNSEVNNLYLKIFFEALQGKKSLKDAAAERGKRGEPSLKEDEINAIMELNKTLRF